MKPTPERFFETALDESLELQARLRSLSGTIGQIVRLMIRSWESGNKVLFAGNGGSAADAMHFAEELVVRYHRDRKALPALALLDPTTVTCAGNDMGFEHVFSRQIEALGKAGDVFIGITTSGNSPNILRALECARKIQLHTIGFLGKDGGKARSLCDIALVIPSPRTARVQEAHKMIYHAMCDYFDAWALGET
ncbi:MAG: phosphoheptose isomerase [Phycisphaerae bacterium]|jgi:D-sedoheptulose 7-phosphate isomerase|nr:MAG: phosphoheptose isomerase [Phycisphaerae bacterium]